MHASVERFLRYVKIETTSSETSGTRPSTPEQWNLIHLLVDEMNEMGVQNVHINPLTGSVMGTIPANTEKKLPVMGFLAHVDTSCAASGKNVQPRIIGHYDGGEIVLGHGVTMDPETYPCLNDVTGEDLIVTDGTTLLGADDKAGVAEIMTMAEQLLASDRPHGTVKIAFTTDEEIGIGSDGFDLADFGCDYAYTVDGGPLGELEYENFNAASARVTIHGVGVHPGTAKNIMKNAAAIAVEFHSLLPREQTPEHTEGREGFLYLMSMEGQTTEAKLGYIIRDHDLDRLREKEQLIRAAADFINTRYGSGTVEIDCTEDYYNMKEKIQPHMHLIQIAGRAFQKVGVKPISIPIRGGTDGARLSYMGLPCPNLSTGGYLYHGVREFIPVHSLELMPEVLCRIVYAYAEGEKEYV